MSVELCVPSLRETGAREAWLSDPETMRFNADLPNDADGYDVATGCIRFEITDWRFWRGVWLYHEPDRYSAFIRRDDGVFLGEVCYWFDPETDAHRTGVIVQAKYRGQGVGTEALRLLTEHCFARDDIDTLQAELPADRDNAVRMYLANGYRETVSEGGIVRLEKKK